MTLCNRIRSIIQFLSNLAMGIAGTGLVLMTVFVSWQVFARYVLNDTPTWTESVALLLMGWFILLGAAVGVREGYHLGLDILLHIAPPSVTRLMRYISDLVIAIFGGGMLWYGLALAQGTWTATLPALGLPGGVVYIPVFIGGALFILFSLERMVERYVEGAH
jgi:TRAP-type C4-dicarboxylate transport system permease small subunit